MRTPEYPRTNRLNNNSGMSPREDADGSEQYKNTTQNGLLQVPDEKQYPRIVIPGRSSQTQATIMGSNSYQIDSPMARVSNDDRGQHNLSTLN